MKNKLKNVLNFVFVMIFALSSLFSLTACGEQDYFMLKFIYRDDKNFAKTFKDSMEEISEAVLAGVVANYGYGVVAPLDLNVEDFEHYRPFYPQNDVDYSAIFGSTSLEYYGKSLEGNPHDFSLVYGSDIQAGYENAQLRQALELWLTTKGDDEWRENSGEASYQNGKNLDQACWKSYYAQVLHSMTNVFYIKFPNGQNVVVLANADINAKSDSGECVLSVAKNDNSSDIINFMKYDGTKFFLQGAGWFEVDGFAHWTNTSSWFSGSAVEGEEDKVFYFTSQNNAQFLNLPQTTCAFAFVSKSGLADFEKAGEFVKSIYQGDCYLAASESLINSDSFNTNVSGLITQTISHDENGTYSVRYAEWEIKKDKTSSWTACLSDDEVADLFSSSTKGYVVTNSQLTIDGKYVTSVQQVAGSFALAKGYVEKFVEKHKDKFAADIAISKVFGYSPGDIAQKIPQSFQKKNPQDFEAIKSNYKNGKYEAVIEVLAKYASSAGISSGNMVKDSDAEEIVEAVKGEIVGKKAMDADESNLAANNGAGNGFEKNYHQTITNIVKFLSKIFPARYPAGITTVGLSSMGFEYAVGLDYNKINDAIKGPLQSVVIYSYGKTSIWDYLGALASENTEEELLELLTTDYSSSFNSFVMTFSAKNAELLARYRFLLRKIYVNSQGVVSSNVTAEVSFDENSILEGNMIFSTSSIVGFLDSETLTNQKGVGGIEVFSGDRDDPDYKGSGYSSTLEHKTLKNFGNCIFYSGSQNLPKAKYENCIQILFCAPEYEFADIEIENIIL